MGIKKISSKDLRDERLSLGLTQVEMALALNTPHGSYLKWENGQRRVPGLIAPALKHVKSQVKK